jgi:flagellar basal-body rod protein FlgF
MPSMQSSLYVALSGQVALQKRLDTIANNIANMNTGGYRAEEVSFSTILSRAGATPTAFATSGENYISRRAGEITSTGNPLDIAVQGNGWFGLQTPDGLAYTRDGRLHIDASGALKSVNNYPIVDAGGAGILLDPSGGPPVISQDGMILQNGRQVGAVGLFSIDASARLSRYDNSSAMSSLPGTPVLDFTANGVMQGMSEGSNVNPVLEMTKMIDVTRSFESASNAIQSTESSLQEAIKTLGGS